MSLSHKADGPQKQPRGKIHFLLSSFFRWEMSQCLKAHVQKRRAFKNTAHKVHNNSPHIVKNGCKKCVALVLITVHIHFLSLLNLPHPANTSGGQGSGHYLWSLLHEATHREPQAVSQGVLVLQHVPALPQTRVRVIPLVGAQPGRGTQEMTWRSNCSTVHRAH